MTTDPRWRLPLAALVAGPQLTGAQHHPSCLPTAELNGATARLQTASLDLSPFLTTLTKVLSLVTTFTSSVTAGKWVPGPGHLIRGSHTSPLD